MSESELMGQMAVTDGRGHVYNLPPRLRVADCSVCRRLIVRDRERVPVHQRRLVGYIGGWRRQYENHSRPVCVKCWDAQLRGKTHERSDQA